MPSGTGRRPTPEERELEKKNGELASLRLHLTHREQALRNLQAEIDAFQRSYAEVLSERLAELEELEAQLATLEPPSFASAVRKYARTEQTSAAPKQKEAAEENDDQPPKGIKDLYRRVAKCIHPDLTSCDVEGKLRQDLMAQANRAYADGDRQTLMDILQEWENGPDAVRGNGPGAELIRAIRRIDLLETRIAAIETDISRLRDSELYHLIQRVEEARHEGVDMLAEMAAKVDLDIARAQKRLFELTGRYACAVQAQGEARLIRFPDVSLGLLYFRNSSSDNYRDWSRYGEARGDVLVPPGKVLRLDVKDCRAVVVKHLMALEADDLQALFLYDADDAVLVYLQGLTGLEQLYLGGVKVTSEGMSLLHGLTGLQKLYLYDTSVCDEGLERLGAMKWLRWVTFSESRMSEEGISALQAQIPGCKVVNLKR